jgi:hypothetical protein
MCLVLYQYRIGLLGMDITLILAAFSIKYIAVPYNEEDTLSNYILHFQNKENFYSLF